MKDQVQRFLLTQEFYREIIDLIPEEVLKKVSETTVRGKLDAILTLGKIEVYLTSVRPDATADNDKLIECWQRIVEVD